MGCKCAKEFFGSFENVHDKEALQDHEDEKDEAMLPKDYNRIKELMNSQSLRGKVKGKETHKRRELLGSDAMAMKAWAAKGYLTTVSIEENLKGGGTLRRYADALIVHNEVIKKGMVKKIRTFQTMHTIELIKCGLDEVPPNLIEIETLRVLRLSRNKIKYIRKDLTKGTGATGNCSQLQRLIIDENKLETIEIGTFSGESVKELCVINLGKNELQYLPFDFCSKATSLEIMDLSFNKLSSLPDSILECTGLRVLDVCNNNLKSLPERLDKLKNLRKLFVNTNLLTEIPTLIGECSKLEKLWVSDNKLRKLPYSIIPLWRTIITPGRFPYGGYLEEIMVDDNPLVVPSVTAFQMGGPDQMFKLFQEHERAMLEAQKKADQLALEDTKEKQAALRDSAAAGQPAIADEGNVMAAEGRALIPNATDVTTASAHGAPEQAEEEKDKEEEEEEEGQKVEAGGLAKQSFQEGNIYYLGKFEDDNEFVERVRTAESALMLLKRQIYVDTLRHVAEAKRDEAEAEGKELPRKIQRYLKDDFTVKDFRGSVRTTDLDIFFCLLVMTAKPLCTSAKQLFEKFAKSREENLSSGALQMDRRDWDYFLNRVPTSLPDDMKTMMWKLVSRGGEGDSARAKLEDFVAALHIHDLALTDPFIRQVSKVLKLQYYCMEMSEFEGRIRGRGNDTANALDALELPSDDEDPGERINGVIIFKHTAEDQELQHLVDKLKDCKDTRYNELDPHEWKQRIVIKGFHGNVVADENQTLNMENFHVKIPSKHMYPLTVWMKDIEVEFNGENGLEDTAGLPIVEGERMAIRNSAEGKATGPVKKKWGMISMSEVQYAQLHNAEAASQDTQQKSDVRDTAFDLESETLSMADASDSPFEAEDCLNVISTVETERARLAAKNSDTKKGKFKIKSEADLMKLMNMPPNEILGISDQPVIESDEITVKDRMEKLRDKEKAREKKRLKLLQSTAIVRDPRFGTNVMSVRRAIREAFRNLPYHDFVALVNFLLRGLKHIKHYDTAAHITFWHSDDPVVRHLMGERKTNKYPKEILTEMGFVCLFDVYWVWPEKHIDPDIQKRLVPAHCPGTERMRLDDLIKLIEHCKKSLDREKLNPNRKFTGHCRAG